jgi:hypothetical protein
MPHHLPLAAPLVRALGSLDSIDLELFIASLLEVKQAVRVSSFFEEISA